MKGTILHLLNSASSRHYFNVSTNLEKSERRVVCSHLLIQIKLQYFECPKFSPLDVYTQCYYISCCISLILIINKDYYLIVLIINLLLIKLYTIFDAEKRTNIRTNLLKCYLSACCVLLLPQII